jgi:uncharacterized membrane protein
MIAKVIISTLQAIVVVIGCFVVAIAVVFLMWGEVLADLWRAR